MTGEYRGDFTRDSFRPGKHFLRVLTQQGRVSLDADWNEQTSILLHHHRALARAVFGDHGASATSRRGFEIGDLATKPGAAPQPVSQDFRIGRGRYYVRGILCEVDGPSMPVVGPAQNLPVNQHGVVVPATTVDGRPLEQHQYVEVWEVGNPGGAVVAQILALPGHGTLVLDTPLSFAANAKLRIRRLTTYRTQPDYRFTHDKLVPASAGKHTVVYLDVWERHVSHVQDDSIREVALGTADTASRSKVVWQVKVAELPQALDPKQQYDDFVRALREALGRNHPAGMLKARATPDVQSTDPCTTTPDARYRGIENQLYRVEVHRGGPSDPNDPKKCATFKWSRENGCVLFPIVGGFGTRTLTLEHLGRDGRSTLREGDLVEARDDISALHDRAGHLFLVEAVDRVAGTVTVNEPVHVGQHDGMHPVLIRWDHAPDGALRPGSDHAAMIIEASGNRHWLPLEDGVEIQFQEPLPGRDPAHYRTGDYWLIPARTATGDVEWPVELGVDGTPALVGGVHVPLARGPHGIEHEYAPLAVITVDSQGVVALAKTPTPTGDCRRRFDIPWT
jgi:hypothetical protein